MAEDGSWEGIRRLGLLSTSALLDRFEVQGERRRRIESARRLKIEAVKHLVHGRALIRDNKPMRKTVLGRCLTGMTPREWYETINRRVFFWVDRRRPLKLLCTRAYRARPHLVLELDTAGLLLRYENDVTLSAINSGATFPMDPAPRGPGTFRSIGDHPRGKAVVELAVDYAVPAATDLALRVSRWRGGEELEEVWRKG
jgi:hypothetical protein